MNIFIKGKSTVVLVHTCIFVFPDCDILSDVPEAVILDNTNVGISLMSINTLPRPLMFKSTGRPHGLGVYAKAYIPAKTQLGPVKGDRMKFCEVNPKNDCKHLWVIDVQADHLPRMLSTEDEKSSNWCRCVLQLD